MLERTTRLVFSHEFLAALAEAGLGQADRRLTDAIGYLSLWRMGGKAVGVSIYGHKDGDMTATYIDGSGKTVFVIGAVPDDNWNYSFHS